MARTRAHAPTSARTQLSGERVFGLTLQNRSLLICRSLLLLLLLLLLLFLLGGGGDSVLLYFREPCIEQTLSSSVLSRHFMSKPRRVWIYGALRSGFF